MRHRNNTMRRDNAMRYRRQYYDRHDNSTVRLARITRAIYGEAQLKVPLNSLKNIL